jgi:hypothetical protein
MESVLTVAGLCLAIAVSAVTLYQLLQTGRKVEEIHVLVNSRLTAVLTRVTELTGALDNAGVEIPPVRADKHL